MVAALYSQLRRRRNLSLEEFVVNENASSIFKTELSKECYRSYFLQVITD